MENESKTIEEMIALFGGINYSNEMNDIFLSNTVEQTSYLGIRIDIKTVASLMKLIILSGINGDQHLIPEHIERINCIVNKFSQFSSKENIVEKSKLN